MSLLAICLLTAIGGAQSFSTTYPGAFLDISATGGTPIGGVTDDSISNIVTTVGNPMFPAGNVRICNNGVALSGTTTGAAGFTNYTIPAAGVPVNMTLPYTSALCPWWDDLYPPGGSSSTTIWYQESFGVLYIMWKDEFHYAYAVGTQQITFEIQVYSAPAPGTPWIQFCYSDTVFGGTAAIFDGGASATIGYVVGAGGAGLNTLHSFDTPGVVADGAVLSIFPPFVLTPTSPFGGGSLNLDLQAGPVGGNYFFAVTFYAGLYPNGWLYGVDIPLPELSAALSFGFPFIGPLDVNGNFTLGPFAGLPSGLTFYAVALGIPAGSPVPTVHTPSVVYTIP
jgi:hypothetical protein